MILIISQTTQYRFGFGYFILHLCLLMTIYCSKYLLKIVESIEQLLNLQSGQYSFFAVPHFGHLAPKEFPLKLLFLDLICIFMTRSLCLEQT